MSCLNELKGIPPPKRLRRESSGRNVRRHFLNIRLDRFGLLTMLM
jgi:hypothetical protein